MSADPVSRYDHDYGPDTEPEDAVICSMCFEEKKPSDFYIDRNRRMAHCRACHVERVEMTPEERKAKRAELDARCAAWLADYPRVWHQLERRGSWPANEYWRPIPRYMGFYEASDLGRVRSLWFINGKTRQVRLTPLLLREFSNERTYRSVTLVTQDGKHVTEPVHRLVLEAFVGPAPDGHDAAHRDGHPYNNCLLNLTWLTRTENEADKLRHGTRPLGEKNTNAKLTEELVLALRKRHASGEPIMALAKLFAIDHTTVRQIVARRTWKHI